MAANKCVQNNSLGEHLGIAKELFTIRLKKQRLLLYTIWRDGKKHHLVLLHLRKWGLLHTRVLQVAALMMMPAL